MNQKLPILQGFYLSGGEDLFDGDNCPEYTEWVKAFAEDHPSYPNKKEYCSSSKAKATRHPRTLSHGLFVPNLQLTSQLFDCIFCMLAMQLCFFGIFLHLTA